MDSRSPCGGRRRLGGPGHCLSPVVYRRYTAIHTKLSIHTKIFVNLHVYPVYLGFLCVLMRIVVVFLCILVYHIFVSVFLETEKSLNFEFSNKKRQILRDTTFLQGTKNDLHGFPIFSPVIISKKITGDFSF